MHTNEIFNEIKISIAKCNVQNLARSLWCRISNNLQQTSCSTQLFRLVWDNRWMWWNAHIIRCRTAMHREFAHRGRAVLTEFCNLRCFLYPARQQEAESSQSVPGRWGQTPSYEVSIHYLFVLHHMDQTTNISPEL